MASAVWSSILTRCGLPGLFLWEIDDLFSPVLLGKVLANVRPVLQAIFGTIASLIWKTRNKVLKETHKWCLLESVSERVNCTVDSLSLNFILFGSCFKNSSYSSYLFFIFYSLKFYTNCFNIQILINRNNYPKAPCKPYLLFESLDATWSVK